MLQSYALLWVEGNDVFKKVDTDAAFFVLVGPRNSFNFHMDSIRSLSMKQRR